MTAVATLADQDGVYLRYTDDVDQKPPYEDTTKTRAFFGWLRQAVFEKHRHAVHDAHAKSHGVLKGSLTVYDLPELLPQAAFRVPILFPFIRSPSCSKYALIFVSFC